MAMSGLAVAASRPEFEIRVGSHELGALDVLSFEADARLSAPYQAVVTLRPARGVEVDPDALIGQPATLFLTFRGGDARALHGVVAGVRSWLEGADLEGARRLRLTIVPRLWRLGKVVRSRIFQDLTVPEIVKKVLDAAKVDHREALSATYPRRGYCVQYAESDLAFVGRLLEEEGITYFFEHSDGSHVMVLADAASAFPGIRGGKALPYREATGLSVPDDSVSDFEAAREVRPGKVTLRDYDDQRPALDLTATAAAATPRRRSGGRARGSASRSSASGRRRSGARARAGSSSRDRCSRCRSTPSRR
jgi:type VI secretion system secreted protein VgrG